MFLSIVTYNFFKSINVWGFIQNCRLLSKQKTGFFQHCVEPLMSISLAYKYFLPGEFVAAYGQSWQVADDENEDDRPADLGQVEVTSSPSSGVGNNNTGFRE